MKNPQVSVIMAVYNGEKFLKEAIDSILNQTYKNLELIIINDASTDTTKEIIKKIKERDNRICLINNESNIGPAAARNRGLKIARGEYIAIMDSDDVSMPDRLEKQVAIIEKNNNVGVVACWITIVDENGNYVGDWRADRENTSPEEIYYTLFFENCIAHSSVLFRKDLVLKIGGYNESFRKSQDYELLIRLSKIIKILKIKEVLLLRKEHIVNTSFDTKRQHKENEEHLFLRNINNILPSNKFDLNKLLSIKYDGKMSGFNVLDLLRISMKINKRIIKTAPPFLSRADLKKSGHKKRNKTLKNGVQLFFDAIHAPINILKFVSNRLLHNSRYFFEYIDFIFSFPLKLSQLKINKASKNILCIVPYMVAGGAERVILNIAEGTNSEKFNFHIVTTTPANNVWYNKFHSHFQNIIVPVKRVVNVKICNKYFRQLIKILNIDIVLISTSLIGYKYLPLLKSEFKDVKTMDLLHVEESTGALDGLEWVTPLLDRRICISNHLKEYMVQKYKKCGIEDRYIKRLKFIQNGIDMINYSPNDQTKGKFKSRFEIPDDVRIISFIGRFSREKTPLLFVDIARRVIEKGHDHKLKFIMAGDGPQYDEVKKTINTYGIDDYFILTGMIDNIVELLADTHILLIVSKSEGIPFAILEAMAMKVLVISTDVGAVHEVIKDNMNGYLINPENNVVESFTCKILDLLSEKSNYLALAKKARETIVSKYSLETMNASYQSIFDELTGDDCD